VWRPSGDVYIKRGNLIWHNYHIKITAFLITCFLAYSQVLNAQTYVIDSWKESYDLTPSVKLLQTDPPFDIDPLLKEQAIFTPYTPSSPPLQTGIYYWGKVDISNELKRESGQSDWVIHFSPNLTNIEAYLVQGDSVTSVHHSGYYRPYYQKEFRPRLQPNLIKISLISGEDATLYFRVIGERPAMVPSLDLEMIPTDVFWKEQRKEFWRHGLFLGFVLMMLTYNLILSFIVKDKAHFFYSFYLLMIAVFHLYGSRLLNDWLAPLIFIENPQQLNYFKIVTYGGLVGYMGFIRSFLDLDKLLPFWDKLLKWLMILAIPVASLDIFLNYQFNHSANISDLALIPFTIIYLLATFMLIIPLSRTKDTKGRFAIAGICAMGLGLLLTIFERMKGVEYSMIFYQAGSILEIIFFTLGLAYRRRLEQQEKQHAAFELERTKLLQEKEHIEAERLKELAEVKSHMYTNITHEFRTPLTVILGMVKEIKDNQQAQKIIERNGVHLLQLVNQMLSLSKSEANELKVALKQGDIVPYLQYITESFHSLANLKNISLSFHADEPSIIMGFDEEKIQHILYNLLSNAIKYTPANGNVILHAKQAIVAHQPTLVITVQDDGIGVAEVNQPHLFDRFYTITTQENDKNKSTGIGLTLTKELTELMGGEIKVESKLGKGSTFTIHLPINDVPEIEESHHFNKEDFPVIPSLPGTIMEEPESYDEDVPVILVVEDNIDVLTYIRTILKDQFNVHFAHNGKEGLEKALEIVPDIVVSDVMMPLMNGFEFCKQLKEHELTSHVLVILLTALSNTEDKITGYKRGADAYLLKPFNKEELLVRIDQLLNTRKLMQQYFTSHVADTPETTLVKAKDMSAQEVDFIDKLRTIVEDNIDDSALSIAILCESVNLSHTQLYRKLKALTNKTPSQFIRSIRLAKAKELLANSTLNISEIAYQVGFNNPNYFSRAFQQEFGTAPSSLR
jgi:signal transduction histidine kinase/DNA-binding response OmpR family regulator